MLEPTRTSPFAAAIAPVLAGYIGLCFVLGDPRRTATSTFAYAKQLMTIPHWGLLFVLGALCMAIAIVLRDARALAVTFFIGGGMYAWWSACFFLSALDDKRASLVAGALWSLAAAVHWIYAARCWRTVA